MDFFNDTWIICAIVALFFLLGLTVLLLFWVSSAYQIPEIKAGRPPFKELQIAYKFHQGPKDEDFELLCAETHMFNPDIRLISITYDFDEVPEEMKRRVVGLILNDEDKIVGEDDKKKLLAKGYQIADFPKVEVAVYQKYPHVNFISAYIASHEVVKKFCNYIKVEKLQAYPLIEIYDGKHFLYAAPLSNQKEFFVSEYHADSEDEVTSEKTAEDGTEISTKDIEEFPDTLSSVDSLMECGSRIEELPSNEDILDSLEAKEKAPSNGSEASTESFEDLQLDS